MATRILSVVLGSILLSGVGSRAGSVSPESQCVTQEEISAMRQELRTLQTVSIALLEELVSAYAGELASSEEQLGLLSQEQSTLSDAGREVDRQAVELDQYLRRADLDDSDVALLSDTRQQVESDALAGIESRQLALREQQSSIGDRKKRLELRRRELLHLQALLAHDLPAHVR
jgi:hypothetical protein